MGEPTSKMRNKEVSEMLDYAFAQYQSKDLLQGKKNIGKYKVDSGKVEYAYVVPKTSATVVRKKGEKLGKITYDANIYNLKAPLKVGDEVGSLNIKEDGKLIKSIKLTVGSSISKINFIELLFRNIKDMIIGNININ